MSAQPKAPQMDPAAAPYYQGAAPPPGAYAPYYQYGNAGYAQPPSQGAQYYPEALPAPAQHCPQTPQQDYPAEQLRGAPPRAVARQEYPLQCDDQAKAAVPAYYDYTAPQTYQEVRKYEGSNQWATGMWKAPCKAPGMCFASFFCPCCCTFMQRRKLLANNWANYRCCAGTCAYACCACFNNNNCGGGAPFCLAMETIFCLPCAVHANRYMVMRHYGLRNECCDLVIMWSACVCQLVSMIIGDGCLNSIADCWYFTVLSCMLAQHDYQMTSFPYPTETEMS